jgi:type II secretory pathway predicted ATPase ExeA
VSERAEGVELFPSGTDPRNYVRTAVAEEALKALQRELRRSSAPVALVGLPGVGKTLLLRLLEQRLAESFHVVYLAFTALPADELCAWVLGLLGEDAGPEPERDLLAASARLEGQGTPPLVMLDDVESMPVATARRLSALLAEAGGSIRVVLALAEGSRSERVLTSLQPVPVRVELRGFQQADETGRYLRAHLVRCDAPQEVRARFDPVTIRDLHRGSGGVPRVLNGLAGELARGNLAVIPRREAQEPEVPLASVLDPFEVTSDPTAYVPRSVTQELLASIEGALRKGARSIMVTGPPGLGKTLLLRVLERRLRNAYRPIAIAYPALLPDELCRWILTLLGEPVTGHPTAALLDLARRLGRSQRNLVLLVDDAGSIPAATVLHLAELAYAADRGVRLVLFAVEDGRVAGLRSALGSDVLTLQLNEPMSETETFEYIYARLARARAPTELVERFDPGTVARLHAESGGIARELHRLAGEVAREDEGEDATELAATDLPEVEAPPESPAPQAPPPPPAVGALESPPIPATAPESPPIPATAPESPPISATAPESPPAPAPRPTAPRVPFGRWTPVYALLLLAILLAAIPLLRGGFPWVLDLPTIGPEPAAPTAVQPIETPAPLARPASEEPVETIPVNINAVPWAIVEVDGEQLGETPLANVPLTPGPHVFRARMPDGEIREHRVEVGPTMRHVVFYAESPPEKEEPVPAPETTAAPVEPPVVREDLAEEPVPAPERTAAPAARPIVREEPAPTPAPERAAAPVSPPIAREEPASTPVPALEKTAAPVAPPIVQEELATAPAPSPERTAASAAPPIVREEPSPTPAPERAAAPVSPPAAREEPASTPAPAPERTAAPVAPPIVREEPAEIPTDELPYLETMLPEIITETVPVPPEEPPEPISVSINATPWATIEIDGEEIGITPMAGVLLTPGDHQFRVYMPDGRVLEESVRISSTNRHIAFGEGAPTSE